jgi:hypothetical protein
VSYINSGKACMYATRTLIPPRLMQPAPLA